MIGEAVVAQLATLVRKLTCSQAVWEWAIWEHDGKPHLHFLKITITTSPESSQREVIYSSSGLILFRKATSLKEVDDFIEYCLATRRRYEETNQIPVNEQGFKIGSHVVELFENFTTDRLDFWGSARAKASWFLKSERPFFIVQYALHDSVRPRLPRPFSLHDGDPPFAHPREVYKHYFSTDVGDGADPWVGIVVPVHAAWIRSFRQVSKVLVVDLKASMSSFSGLFFSAICRKKDGTDVRERIQVKGLRITLPLSFKATSIDLALFLDELQIDFIEWHAPARRRRTLDIYNPISLDAPSEPSELLFPETFLNAQPNDVRRCLQEANGCANHGFWVAARLMLRKAVDIAVNLRLKQLGKEDEICVNDQEKSLSARLELLASHAPGIRRDIRDILVIKWFGDKGAHSRMAVFENDIRSIVAPKLRSFLTHLGLTRPKRQ